VTHTLRFWLGTHHPHWLATAGVELFVSRRALARYKTLPRASFAWALDSGGFSELTLHGRWEMTPAAYVAEVRRYRDEIGHMAWAAPQDWMCEPDMIKRTGLTVADHQRLTVENFLELNSLAPELPWIPVLQGWSLGDYLDHADAYGRAGVSLADETIVGVGTVCRRQHTGMVSGLLACLCAEGYRLHGFGFKLRGLKLSAHDLASADSLAWSYQARRNPPLPGHGVRHKNCANCMEYAMGWRDEVVDTIGNAMRREAEAVARRLRAEAASP